MPTEYKLKVEHDGTKKGDFCIYQTYENQPNDIYSLVWFSKPAHPGTTVTFGWKDTNSFFLW